MKPNQNGYSMTNKSGEQSMVGEAKFRNKMAANKGIKHHQRKTPKVTNKYKKCVRSKL